MNIDFAYTNYNNLEHDYPDLVPLVLPDEVDLELENLIHSMSQEHLELVICLYFGFSAAETMEILQYANLARFYTINKQVQKFYQQQKKERLTL